MVVVMKDIFHAGWSGMFLLTASSCAWKASPAAPPLQSAVQQVEAAYDQLPDALPAYNAAMREVCREMEVHGIPVVTEELRRMNISFVSPPGDLKITHIRVAAATSTTSNSEAGAPIVIQYEVPPQSHYPPEGLFVNGTAVYEKTGGGARVVIHTGGGRIRIGQRSYDAAMDPVAAGDHLNRLSGKLGGSGFINMIRPLGSSRKPRVYLLDPYDPEKIPLLMVHGLQSTPLAFAELVKSLRREPEFRKRYQIWQFHYASGTPVLVNAVSLRASLNEVISTLDPQGRSVACKRIVIVGHSMGGVISHTLVSSSGEKVWSSIFKVPASRLEGDPEAVRNLHQILHFKRDSRISKVIFMAAPHRGSPTSLSFIGMTGNLVTRLSAMEEHRFTALARRNEASMTNAAAEFYNGGRFSAVRTLSPRSPALVAVSKLPIEVPFHSIIGQKKAGRIEDGSDGVVPYWSSHLDGARSEKIVRSGHGIISNPEAVAEVKRILLSN